MCIANKDYDILVPPSAPHISPGSQKSGGGGGRVEWTTHRPYSTDLGGGRLVSVQEGCEGSEHSSAQLNKTKGNKNTKLAQFDFFGNSY